jgi:multidrug resistance efflux pump
MADVPQIKQQVADLNAKVDTLQASVDAEQAQIQGLLDTNAQVVVGLQAEVARLQAIIDGGGVVTPEDLQSISDGITTASDKLATTQADIEGTVA